MEQTAPVQQQLEDPPTVDSPITLREVLRAIFLPPRDTDALPLPALPVPHVWDFEEEREEGAELEVQEDLTTPSAIAYEDSPIEPVPDPSPQRIAFTGIGIIVAILVAYLAQSAALQGSGLGSEALYFLAGLAWLGLLMFEFAPPNGGLLRRGPFTMGGGAARPLQTLTQTALSTRAALGSVAFALSVLTYVYSANNLFTLPGVLGWIISTVLWMVVVAESSPETLIADVLGSVRTMGRPELPRLQTAALLVAAFLVIMGAGVFFRVYQLDSIPNEMTSDHVEKLLDANDVAHGIYHIFFTRNAGREAIQFYFVPLVARLSGTDLSFMSLKIATVLEALALIPLMILLGRELVDRETGFYAASLLAISWWHILLGRLGLRIVLTPLMFTLVLITLIRGIRTGTRKSWVWAGFWMGLGVYSYQAMRITPLVAVAAFLIAVAGPALNALNAQRSNHPNAIHKQIVAANVVSRQGVNLLASGVVALAIFVPMLRVWHDYPTDLWNRVINRTTENEIEIEGSATQVFIDNYIDALGMFNFEGDASWFAAVPGKPTLDQITGVLLFLGVIAWLVRLRVRRDPVDVFIIAAGLVMLLPSALAIAFPVENPSTTRGSGTLPIVLILAAWPISLLRQRWSAVLGRHVGTGLAALLIAVMLAGAAVFNYRTYFIEYAASYRHSALNPGEVADAVREVVGPDAPLDGVWLQGWPFWHDYRAIGIEAGDIAFDNAILDEAALTELMENFPDEFAVRPLVFIVHPEDETALTLLKSYFPDGDAEYHNSETEGRDFILFIVRGSPE